MGRSAGRCSASLTDRIGGKVSCLGFDHRLATSDGLTEKGKRFCPALKGKSANRKASGCLLRCWRQYRSGRERIHRYRRHQTGSLSQAVRPKAFGSGKGCDGDRHRGSRKQWGLLPLNTFCAGGWLSPRTPALFPQQSGRDCREGRRSFCQCVQHLIQPEDR